MKVRYFLIICLTVVLGGCASDPEPRAYYLLARPVVSTVTGGTGDHRPTLVIESIELAEYLRQSGLVLQSGENQLAISRTHLWAEGLDKSVPKVLLGQLQQKSNDFRFYLKFSDYVSQTDYRLRLHIESLQATDRGDVVCTGRYQLITSADPGNPVSANFAFKQDLNADGYAQAVEQMQTLLGEVADTILDSLNDIVESVP